MAGDILQRFWNTGAGGAKLRYVAGTGATSQIQLTDGVEWLSAIAGNNQIGLQFRVRAPGTTNSEAQLESSARLSILRNGNVGVGLTAPTERLHVIGNGLFSGNLTVAGALNASGSALTNLNAGNVTTGTLNSARLGVVPAANGGTGLSTAGAAGSFLRSNGAGWTSSALQSSDIPAGSTNYIQNNPASQQAATVNFTGLRTEANAESPNVIGGHSINEVTSNVVGATIGGGGGEQIIGGDVSMGFPNRVTDNYGTVGGGFGNTAGDNAGTTTDRTYATVGGGLSNTASGVWSTVGGGGFNTASGPCPVDFTTPRWATTASLRASAPEPSIKDRSSGPTPPPPTRTFSPRRATISSSSTPRAASASAPTRRWGGCMW
ncbi:MAG: hypothetical protein LC795_14755 [Acidobacteria bacterium]|nr:hypothetical protein [Acidobacteriota bacterium]